MYKSRDDLQREVHALEQEIIENEKKYQLIELSERTWKHICTERNNYIFKNNINETVQVRLDVAILISNYHSFTGKTKQEDNDICYYLDEELIAKVPLSLVYALSSGETMLHKEKGFD